MNVPQSPTKVLQLFYYAPRLSQVAYEDDDVFPKKPAEPPSFDELVTHFKSNG